ncbi:hypothetical protein TB1_031629 [Malus domestica]
MTGGEVSCLANSATTHTILREQHFNNFVPKKAHLVTLLGLSNLIEGYEKTRLMLSNGTVLTIKECLYSPRSRRMLLSSRDIRDNQFHVETTKENGSEFLCITSYEYGYKHIHKKLERFPSGLYIITIHDIKSHHVASFVPGFQSTLLLWTDHMRHPGRDMMCRILKSSHGHHLPPYVGFPP